MKEELISYETAKLAKEKGYDIPSSSTWSYHGNLKKPKLIKWDDELLIDEIDGYECLAPTQSLLQKWLRDNHNIHVYVVTNFFNKSLLLGYIYMIDKFNCDNIHDGNSYDEDELIKLGKEKGFDSYDEALEHGLNIGLNLI